MSDHADTRDYDEYDDDRQYDRLRDYDDFDEAESAFYEQMDEDVELVWKVQCHELAHAMRQAPLPGMSFSEEYRRRFHGAFPPFPPDPTVGELRNLFDNDAYKDARNRVKSDHPDEIWFGAKFLNWRNQAIGRYCLNLNCLKRLPERPPGPGRPRLYCNRRCKDAAIKRMKYHEQHPDVAYRLRPMLVPGFPFSVRPHRNSLSMRLIALPTDDMLPWRAEEGHKPDERATQFPSHFRRWLLRRRRTLRSVTARDRRKSLTTEHKRLLNEFKRTFGMPLDEMIALAVSEGYVLSDDDCAAFEECLGESVHSVVTGEDDHPDDDDGRPGIEPLPQTE